MAAMIHSGHVSSAKSKGYYPIRAIDLIVSSASLLVLWSL